MHHSEGYGDGGNGIACPKCSSEMVDTSPDMVLTSSPPQKYVNCPKCGYKGLAVA